MEHLLIRFVIQLHGQISNEGYELPGFILGTTERLDIQSEIQKIKNDIKTEFKFRQKYFPKFYKEQDYDLKIKGKDNITFDFHKDLVKCNDKLVQCELKLIFLYFLAESSIFKAMLEVPMLESEENSIAIKNFDSIVISGFRSCIYEGIVDITACPEQFYTFGHQYGLDDIRKLAELVMRSQINSETCIKFHKLTLIYDELNVLESDLKEYFLR